MSGTLLHYTTGWPHNVVILPEETVSASISRSLFGKYIKFDENVRLASRGQIFRQLF